MIGFTVQALRSAAFLGAAALSFFQATGRPVLEARVSTEVVLNQPVVLWQRVRNSSKAPLELSLGYDGIGHWNFSLRRPDGSVQRARPTIRLGPSVGSGPEQVVVAPGRTYVQGIVLDEWLRFDQVGTYVLILESTHSLASGRATVDRLEHTIVVKPRDAEVLRRRCAELVDMLPNRSGSDPQLTRVAATNELLWSRDPGIVLCLERAIDVGETPAFFTPLVAIGTVEAREAIVRLTNHRLDYIVLGAKNALARFRLK